MVIAAFGWLAFGNIVRRQSSMNAAMDMTTIGMAVIATTVAAMVTNMTAMTIVIENSRG